MENNTYRKINLTKEDSMSKQILFKKTRESIIKKLSNPYYKKRIECSDYNFLTILELIYILFHLKEMNEILNS